ncbi:MAG: ATP-binding protein [Anaerolineae bacterium]
MTAPVYIVLAVIYLILLVLALRNRADRTPEVWLLGYIGASIALMGLHALLASGGLADSFPVPVAAAAGMIVSVSLFTYLTLTFISYKNSPAWLGLSVLWFAVVTVTALQGVPGLLSGQSWVPEATRSSITLSTELTVGAWLIVSGALFMVVLRDYLSEPRPLFATRILFWAVIMPFALLGDILLAWAVNPPWSIAGSVLRLLGAIGAVYAVGANRVFDFRELTRWLVSRTVLTIVLGAVIFGGVMYALYGNLQLQQWAIALVIGLVLGIVIQPVYQFFRWVLRSLIERDVADAAEIVSQYSQRIGEVIELRELARVAVQSIDELLQARRGYLILATRFEESLILEAIGAEGDSRAGVMMLSSPIYDEFIKTGRPVLQYDIEYSRQFRGISPPERDYLAKLGMDVFAPIVKDEDLVGIIALGPKTNDEPYRAADLDLLAALANQTVAALENARLVADLKRLNYERSALNDNLRETNERLERMDAVKSDFIDIASHELRTPLTQIKGYSALLLEMSERNMLSPDETMEILESLNAAAERMGEVIAAMLDVSQIDVESLDLNFIETSLANVLKLSIEAYSDAIHERGLTLVARGLRNLPPIHADYQRLTQAYQNLITNAVKFTPDGGKINISGEVYERDSNGDPLSVRIAIQDTGIGIDPEHQEYIFDKFYRVGPVALHSTGSTKFKGAGPGLGLPIS